MLRFVVIFPEITLSYGLTNTPPVFCIACLWPWPLISACGEVASTNLLHSSSPMREEDTFHFMDEENKVQKSYIICPKLDFFELGRGKHKDEDIVCQQKQMQIQ